MSDGRVVRPSDTICEMTWIVLPQHANALGSAFGGAVMGWIDIAAAISAQRYTRCDVVTASMDQLSFRAPIPQGHVAVLQAMVNWSETLQTVLANEQVIDGVDERTGQPVVQRMMAQWFFRITRYAEELLCFDGLDWPEPVVAMQKNWIGRSEGARVTSATPCLRRPRSADR